MVPLPLSLPLLPRLSGDTGDLAGLSKPITSSLLLKGIPQFCKPGWDWDEQQS